MALQSKAQPSDKYVAGYNPIVFASLSNLITNEGFKYVYNLYSGGTSTLFASAQIAPRIGDNYGIFSVEKFIQNYLSYNFSGSTQIPESWVHFDVKVGESYSSKWTYDDYQFYDATGTTDNGYTQLISNNTGNTHSFIAGDIINITQSTDPNAVWPALSGIHTIRTVPNPYSIVVDMVYNNSNPGFTVSGYTIFADNSRIVNEDILTFSGKIATNSAVPFVTKKLNNANYIMSGTSADKLFLTTMPNPSTHTAGEDIWFNMINNYSTNAYYLFVQNSNGDTFRKFIADTMDPLMQQPVGPNNIGNGMIAIVGTGPVVKSSTTWYDVWVTNVGTAQVSEKFRINIDTRCIINYGDDNGGDISISFLDRLGSFGSFAFQLKRQDNTSIKRDSYNKYLGEIQGTEWTYNLTDRGQTIYNTDLIRTITLNTNWMSEADAQYFDELVSSPVTFIKWNGEYLACTVTDSGYETTYQKNKTLMRKTITVAISNNDTINI